MSEKVREVIGNVTIPEKFEKGMTFVVIRKDNDKGEKKGDVVAVEFGGQKKTDAEKAETLRLRKERNKKAIDYRVSLRKTMIDAKKIAKKTLQPSDVEKYNIAEKAYNEVKDLKVKEILALL